jgi:hypothetical protein
LALSLPQPGWAAYSSHQNDSDVANFLAVYPFARSTKLDDCSLCHPGGKYIDNKTYGSCDYCHLTSSLGQVADYPLNSYGQAYKTAGRSQAAIRAIEGDDSDGDTFSNLTEIQAFSFPGAASDYPGLLPAHTMVLSYKQISKLVKHKEFLLMNASKSQDSYVLYEGVPLKDLLASIPISPGATQITVFAPDGFSKKIPIAENGTQYNVDGPYQQSIYCSGLDFVDYPKKPVYENGATIPGEQKLILAYKRAGKALSVGKLIPDTQNPGRLVLDGEGPFRLVPPQKTAGCPDRPSTNPTPVGDGFDYDANKDHNAGSSVRSVTAIRVEPLPAGTTDFSWYEGGWNLVDQDKIVIYGAIEPVTAPVTGVVADAKKSPLAGVKVSFGLVSMGQVKWLESDGDGEFGTELPPGDYVVKPVKTGYTFKPESVQLKLSAKGKKLTFKAYPNP